MKFLKFKPEMGYYLVENNGKKYFVFDIYDNPSVLHMYEVDDEDIKIIIQHQGDGLSLDELLIKKHQYDFVIDRNEFVKNKVIIQERGRK